MLRPSDSALVEKRFLDFVAVRDRESFMHYMNQEATRLLSMTGSATDASPVHVLHANLLDVDRKAFAVEMFMACVVGVDGNRMHLLGVKEVLEDGRQRIVEQREGPQTAIVDLSLMDQSTYSNPVSSHEDSVQGTDSGDAVSVGSNDRLSGQFWFEFMFSDILQKRMRVVAKSNSLAAVFGATVQLGTDISKLLWPGVLDDIATRLEHLILKEDNPEDEYESVVMKLQFKPEHLKRCKIYVNSYVKFTIFGEKKKFSLRR
jgi:hypothetical protein